MWRTAEGSTGRLVQLCAAYFFFYVVTGVTVKWFLAAGMNDVAFLSYSTLGGTVVCLSVALALGWWRLETKGRVRLLGREVPGELAYIVPSGVCTAVIIPTTTLMYTLPISVMVAMVIMRGSVIVLSRAVDAVQIRQGILRKRVYREEDIAVGFAILAVSVHLFFARGGFDFVRSVAAVSILGSYVVAYAIRIYIMNYFKNTRGPGVRQDNKGFFALEQIAASATLLVVALACFEVGEGVRQIADLRAAVTDPRADWPWAILAGAAFGAVAFFSVFIFMFQGRTATFAGLVNRLTSLVAGTTATILSAALFGGRFPKGEDWASLVFILVAVGFLTLAERRRAAELARGTGQLPK